METKSERHFLLTAHFPRDATSTLPKAFTSVDGRLWEGGRVSPEHGLSSGLAAVVTLSTPEHEGFSGAKRGQIGFLLTGFTFEVVCLGIPHHDQFLLRGLLAQSLMTLAARTCACNQSNWVSLYNIVRLSTRLR